MVAQALRQADADVAIEAWADRSAAPRDLAQLMSEVTLSAPPPHSELPTALLPPSSVLLKRSETLQLKGQAVAELPLHL